MAARRAWVARGALIAFVVSGAALAQSPAASDSGQLDEILVTAQKVEQRLSDVPMSITALSGDDLRTQGVTLVSDLQKVVPGFTYQTNNFGGPVYTLRGVGLYDEAIAAAPTVSVYTDQVPLPYSVMTQGAALDVQRVEVLKGPQGTLFGQNSTGGAINYIANKPTRQLQAGGTVSFGNFAAFHGDGFVSGPLADAVTARVAVSTDQRGNWQQSQTRDDGLGRRNFTAGRLLLDWSPSDAVSLELNVNGWVDKSDTQAEQFVSYSPQVPNGYQDIVPQLQAYRPARNNDREADWDPDQSLRRDDNLYQIALRGDWIINTAVRLTSITAYADFHENSPQDIDGTALNDATFTVIGSIRTVSQELRLSGRAADNKLGWMVGVNYEKDWTVDNEFGRIDSTNSGVGALRFSTTQNQNLHDVETKAGFGSLDYAITSTLSAQGSARYTQSDTDFRGCLRDAGSGAEAAAFSQIAASPIGAGQCITLDPATFAPVSIVRDSLDENNTSWRVGLDWKPVDDALLYANVTKGYKAGGFTTTPAILATQLLPIKQEQLQAYETGFKTAFFNRLLELSGAGFYYDYKDKQILGYVTTAFGNLPGLVSIPKSRVEGGEVTVNWLPVRGLTVTAGGTYVATRVNSSFLTNDPLGNTVDIKGESFPDTPRWQITGDISYRRPLSDTLVGYLGASPHFHSASNAAFAGGPVFELPSATLLDLRLGIESSSHHWSAEIWGRNVTDRFYLVGVTHAVDTISRTTGMPATFGASFSYQL